MLITHTGKNHNEFNNMTEREIQNLENFKVKTNFNNKLHQLIKKVIVEKF